LVEDYAKESVKAFIERFVVLGHHPKDPEEEKLKKSSLLVVSGPFAIAGIVWGVLYFASGLIIPGAIPFCYGILSTINIISFAFSKQYIFFRNSQLFLILILPFALQISLGGFVPSSAVMYWAIIAPAGAMFFDSIKRSVYWFVAYLSLVLMAYLINDLLPDYVAWDLSEDFINTLFLMNIFGVSIIVFGILYYFVSTITKLNKENERQNEVLREQSEKLMEMDQIKSKFFANISHEFRTPLTLILGIVNKQIQKPQSPPNLKDSKTMERNAQRLLQLINQLLDLSKLESGGMKLQAAEGDIVLFVKNSTAQFESMATGKDIKLTFNGYPVETTTTSDPIRLYFDPKKIQKVCSNLISNAVKFTPRSGEIGIEVELVAGREGKGDQVAIKVINSGPEIPVEKLSRIFDRFYQVDSNSNRAYEGTGIGLALVKELTELHHGHIKVESKMNRTTFIVELPLSSAYLNEDEMVDLNPSDFGMIAAVAEQPSSSPATKEQEGNTKPDEDHLEVLVVEDNTDLRAFIIEALSSEYQVTAAFDGVGGFEKAESLIPDLIVSDVMMPRMDGYDLCKKLKTNDKTNHIPVILLTAKAAKENKLEGLRIGADDYLVKPFDEEELRIRIRNLITIRQKLQRKFRNEIRHRPKEIKVASVHQKFLEALKVVIDKNIDNESFSVEDLGRQIGMSRSQIHRKLKALTNQSATTFIRNYRLYQAAELLEANAGNITEIAYQVGFNSQTYFSSSFQELFGCSPTDYRNARKSETKMDDVNIPD
jgi:signal transduction histidine kinase/DNA-binding response OmpR family regulator